MSSKYGVAWYSDSKKCYLEIETLNDFHLVAAYKKRLSIHDAADVVSGERAREIADDVVLAALKAELDERKLNPAYKGGRAPEPETAGG